MGSEGSAAEAERLTQELFMARELQQSLLPDPPQITGWEIAISCLPATEMSGDFYDFLDLGAQRIGIVLGDVTGKGMAAAMVMVAARSMIRMHATGGESGEAMLNRVNQQLSKDIGKRKPVALSYAVLDLTKQVLEAYNAGQQQPILWRATTGQCELVKVRGFPLGIVSEGIYSPAQISFTDADTVVFYSDGVVEAQNEADELYDYERLQQVITRIGHESAQTVLQTILSDVQNFIGTVPPHDDITLIVLKRLPRTIEEALHPAERAARRVLIVDDEQDILNALSDYLAGNYVPLVARDTATAMELLARERPDIVLLDIRMPQVSGDVWLHTIRQQGIDVPVIIISAYLTRDLAINLLKLGANRLVTKPLRLQRVSEEIEQLCKTSTAEHVEKKEASEAEPATVEGMPPLPPEESKITEKAVDKKRKTAIVNEDLGYRYQNLRVDEYPVEVMGGIATGAYRVYCEKDLIVRGVIGPWVRIYVGGDLSAHGGILGTGQRAPRISTRGRGGGKWMEEDDTITVKGDIRAQFIQNRRQSIRARNLFVEKDISFSKVEVEKRGSADQIIGGQIVVGEHLEVNELGAPNGVATSVKLGVDQGYASTIHSLGVHIQQLSTQIREAEKRIDPDALHRLETGLEAQRSGGKDVIVQLLEKRLQQQRAAIGQSQEAVRALRQKLEEAQQERKAAQQALSALTAAELVVQGTVYPGVVVQIREEVAYIDQQLEKVRFFLKDGDVKWSALEGIQIKEW